jgi:hypothetical protein
MNTTETTNSDTNPVPPTGETPTTVPLEISAGLNSSTIPLNIFPSTGKQIYKDSLDIFLTTFDINANMGTGTKLFEWSSIAPLGDFSNIYNTFSFDDTNYIFCPWSLHDAFYSKAVQIKWQLILQPIKISDCRVSIDIVFNYNDSIHTIYNVKTLANDSIHLNIDDQAEIQPIDIPQFQITDFHETDVGFITLSGQPTIPNPSLFIPRTRLTIFIRNRYQPNLTQPDIMSMVVKLRPTVHVGSDQFGKSAITTFNPLIDTRVHLPYFLYRRGTL